MLRFTSSSALLPPSLLFVGVMIFELALEARFDATVKPEFAVLEANAEAEENPENIELFIELNDPESGRDLIICMRMCRRIPTLFRKLFYELPQGEQGSSQPRSDCPETETGERMRFMKHKQSVRLEIHFAEMLYDGPLGCNESDLRSETAWQEDL